MLTSEQCAEQIETPYPAVMRWLQRELIPVAEKYDLPSGGWYYLILEGTLPPDLKPRLKKQQGEDGAAVSTATDAPDDGAPSEAIWEEKPAKPAKKRAGKKATTKASKR